MVTRQQILLLGLGLSGLGVAHAGPGDHIGTDEVELVPSVELYTQHRTNVYLQEGEFGGGEAVTPGTAIRLHPYLTLKADTQEVLLRMNAGYTARKYLQEEVINLDRYRDFDINANLTLLRTAVVGLKVRDNFSLNGYESEASSADNPYIQILVNDAAGRLTVRPGSSLELDVGGNITVDDYQAPVANDTTFVRSGQNSRTGYGPAAEIKWKFLPKTAVVGSWSMEWFQWANNVYTPSGSNTDGSFGSYLGRPDGRTYRFEGGIRGRFTERLVLGLTAGYGATEYDEQSVLDELEALTGEPSGELDSTQGFGADLKGLPGLLIGAEVAYSPLESQTITLGYRKDFQDVFFTNYVAYNRLTAAYNGTFADRYGVQLAMNYRLEDYDGEVDRTDHRIVTRGALAYNATKYLSVNLGGGWKRRASADGQNPDIEFDDVDVQLGVTFTY